jgi:mannose-6-phosphate isomerase-like protein (cupin superfamily)
MNKVYQPEWKKYEKVWGYETTLINCEEYCGKVLHLKKGYRCSIHKHKLKQEHFHILSGTVLMEVGDQKYVMKQGDTVGIGRGTYHRFTGITDADILEISTTHYEDDSYRITHSEKVTSWKKYVVDRWRRLRGVHK